MCYDSIVLFYEAHLFLPSSSESILKDMCFQIQEQRGLSRRKRVWGFVKDPKRIQGMEKQLDKALFQFSVCFFSTFNSYFE